ncbi:unnamed protein product [Didymodactylos carnosus]|uniref:Uncharacterized protein n=1 Tax=Didymodactylos carnosus TaxID=1234261 RepID=A0A816EU18_9BILA|nr:unnamed protein product [Didymodactylos carnosus]CAF4583780.1 unnamed protein product [Didymodactylos carnosus]
MHRKAPIALIELVSADTTTHSHNLRSRTQCKLPTLTMGLQVFEKSFIRTRIPDIVDRTNEVNFCRMRIGFSQLKFDLFTHTLVSDPSCSCGADESAVHFLINCRQI